MSAIIAAWCAAHPRIRRACIYEPPGDGAGERGAIHVLVDVEPVMDSEEVLPVWLAHAGTWQRELEARTARTIRLGTLGPYEEVSPDLRAAWLPWVL